MILKAERKKLKLIIKIIVKKIKPVKLIKERYGENIEIKMEGEVCWDKKM